MFQASGMTIKSKLGSVQVLSYYLGVVIMHTISYQVTDAVHQKQSFIYLQLWALGRQADANILKKEGDYPYVSSSDVTMSFKNVPPRPLTKEEITKYVELYAKAAKNAIEAGFDGVEIHGANGMSLKRQG
jgi:NADPH2 dehydrogenase